MPSERLTQKWSDWCFHPLRSRQVAHVLREHWHADDSGSVTTVERDKRTNAERWVEIGATRRSAKEVRRAARKVRRLAIQHMCLRDAGEDHRRRAADAYDVIQMSGSRRRKSRLRPVYTTAYSGQPVTAEHAKKIVEEARSTIDEQTIQGSTLHLHAKSRLGALPAYLLLFVDVLALFISTARVFNVSWQHPTLTPLLVAAVFSIVGAGVMAKIAMGMGKHLWAWRQSGPAGEQELPPRSGILLIYVAVLVPLSLFSGFSIWTRIYEEATLADSTGLGIVLGLLVGAAGAAAPWIVALQELYDGSVQTRRLAGMAPVLQYADNQKRSHERAAARADRSATRVRRQAEQLYVTTVHSCGNHHLRADEIVLVARSLSGLNERHEEVAVPDDWSVPMAALAARLRTDLRPLQIALSHMAEEPWSAPDRVPIAMSRSADQTIQSDIGGSRRQIANVGRRRRQRVARVSRSARSSPRS